MKAPKFEVYEAKDGHRWRLAAANGRIIAESGEAYTRRNGATKAIDTVIQACGFHAKAAAQPADRSLQ